MRLPLLGRSASKVTVKESGKTIWAHGKFVAAAAGVDGVRGAVADEAALSGAVISVRVSSGSFSFAMVE